jgi:hypothetical protein
VIARIPADLEDNRTAAVNRSIGSRERYGTERESCFTLLRLSCLLSLLVQTLLFTIIITETHHHHHHYRNHHHLSSS